jgi:hypothetical protein
MRDKLIYTIADAIINSPVFTEDLASLFGIDLDMEDRLSLGDIAIKEIFGDMSFKKSRKEIITELKRILRKK